MTKSFEIPIIKNISTLKQTLPISLNISKFDFDLLTAPTNLKDFIHQYNHKKEIFDFNKRHDTIDLTTKNFFSNNYIVDVFPVHYCSNITTGYNFGNISITQTQETQNVNSQSYPTASKKLVQ